MSVPSPGPFDPSDTAYADWAPAESERNAVVTYLDGLERKLAAC